MTHQETQPLTATSHTPPTETSDPPMSSHPTKKKRTVAQVKAQKEQRRQNSDFGYQLLQEVKATMDRLSAMKKACDDELSALLVQATRACEMVEHHPTLDIYPWALRLKATIHDCLGQHAMAVAALREADDRFALLKWEGLVKMAAVMDLWGDIVTTLGCYSAKMGQLEASKRCFERVLAWPCPLWCQQRVAVFHGMALYHKERKDWVKMKKCCEDAFSLFPGIHEELSSTRTGLLLLLPDAAEGQGDMRQAREYDEQAKKAWVEGGKADHLVELMPCYRRKAIELLAAERPHDAVGVLRELPEMYAEFFSFTSVNLMQVTLFQPVVAALKVLADALEQKGNTPNRWHFFSFFGASSRDLVRAGQIRVEVEEIEAIVAAYWMEVLRETRRELRERQRAAVAVRGAPGVTLKKSKAAKRKQQKRKAQQQRKAAEKAAAATVVEAAAGGADMMQGQGEDRRQVREEQKKEEQAEEVQQQQQDSPEQEEDSGQHGIAAAAAALAAMAVSGKKDREEEGEEGEERAEEECAVCLNAIDSDNDDNPAGPPLTCGHRYHAFCLHFWVERCTSKCIEPTCPYCRAPLQEMEGGHGTTA